METLVLTALTVLKVLTAAAVGGGVAFALPQQTVKDLSFLAGNIFSPFFTFSNLVATLTWDLVVTGAVMFVFAVVTMGSGFGLGWILGHCLCSDEWGFAADDACNEALDSAEGTNESAETHEPQAAWWRSLLAAVRKPSPREYKPLYCLCLGTQNTGTFPIALMMSMRGRVSWFDDEAYSDALSLIFVYNALWNVVLWTLALHVIRSGARLRQRAFALWSANNSPPTLHEVPLPEAHRHNQVDDELPRASSPSSAAESDGGGSFSSLLVEMLDLNRSITAVLVHGSSNTAVATAHPVCAADSCSSSLRPLPTTGSDAVLAMGLDAQQQKRDQGVLPPLMEQPEHVVIAQKIATYNPPLLASVLGIVCGVVPALRLLFQYPPLSFLLGGLSLIGDGSVPLSLLVLGANLTSSGLGHIKTVDSRFLVVGVLGKTIFLPAVNVAVYFLLDGMHLVPTDPGVRVAIWVELIAPTAIMASVICKLENYMTECTTSLLLIQYVTAVATTTAWLWLFLAITSSYA